MLCASRFENINFISLRATFARSTQLALSCSNKYRIINNALLEFVTPSIEYAITEQVQNGIKNISIFPFFLAPGNHVKIDMPRIINQHKIRNPDVIFSIFPAFGCFENIIEWILSLL